MKKAQRNQDLENIVHSLNIEGKKSRLNLVTMGQEKVQDTFVIPNLEVSDICGKNTLALPPVFTQSRLYQCLERM